MRMLLLITILLFSSTIRSQEVKKAAEQKLFVYGGQINKEFIKFTAKLTGKEKPKICFLPTASGDDEKYIKRWYTLCSDLDVEPYIVKVWINSYEQKKTFEEVLMGMDAIMVGGGNTLNMLAIWKAQKIDLALKNAYDKGVVLAGGSAGSLCWFNGGTTDSRPKELSIVKGLGFIDFSHCPHYHSEESRKPLYHQNILSGKLSDGYACDDQSGILFVNGNMKKAVTIDLNNNSYWVHKKDGKIIEEKIDSEIIK